MQFIRNMQQKLTNFKDNVYKPVDIPLFQAILDEISVNIVQLSLPEIAVRLSKLLVDLCSAGLDRSFTICQLIRVIIASQDYRMTNQEFNLNDLMSFVEMFYSSTNILKSNFNESITMYDVSVIMFLKMANLRKLVDFVDCLKLRCEKCFNENSVIKNDTLHQIFFDTITLFNELFADDSSTPIGILFDVNQSLQSFLDTTSQFLINIKDNPSNRNTTSSFVLNFIEQFHLNILNQPTLDQQIIMLQKFNEWLVQLPVATFHAGDIIISEKVIVSSKPLVQQFISLCASVKKYKGMQTNPFIFVFHHSVSDSMLTFLLIQDLQIFRLFICCCSGLFQKREGFLHEYISNNAYSNLANLLFMSKLIKSINLDIKIAFIQLNSNLVLSQMSKQFLKLMENHNVFNVLLFSASKIQEEKYRFLFLSLLISLIFGQKSTIKHLRSNKFHDELLIVLNQNFKEDNDIYLLAFSQTFLANSIFGSSLINYIRSNISQFSDNIFLSNLNILVVLEQFDYQFKYITLQQYEINEYLFLRSQIAVKFYASLRQSMCNINLSYHFQSYFMKYQFPPMPVSDETVLYLNGLQLNFCIQAPPVKKKQIIIGEEQPYIVVYKFMLEVIVEPIALNQFFEFLMSVDVLSLYFQSEVPVDKVLQILQKENMLTDFIERFQECVQDEIFQFNHVNMFSNTIQDTSFELMINYTNYYKCKEIATEQSDRIQIQDIQHDEISISLQPIIGDDQSQMLDSLFGDVVTGTNDFIEKPVTAIPLVHDSKQTQPQEYNEFSYSSRSQSENSITCTFHEDDEDKTIINIYTIASFVKNQKNFANKFSQEVDYQSTTIQNDYISTVMSNHISEFLNKKEPPCINNMIYPSDFKKVVLTQNQLTRVIEQPTNLITYKFLKQKFNGPFQCNFCGKEIPPLEKMQFSKNGQIQSKPIQDVVEYDVKETDDEIEYQILQQVQYCPDSKTFSCLNCAGGRQLVTIYDDISSCYIKQLKYLIPRMFEEQMSTFSQPIIELSNLSEALMNQIYPICLQRLILQSYITNITGCKILKQLFFLSNEGFVSKDYYLSYHQLTLEDIFSIVYDRVPNIRNPIVNSVNQHLFSLKPYMINNKLMSAFNSSLSNIFDSSYIPKSRVEAFINKLGKMMFAHIFQCQTCQALKQQCAVCDQLIPDVQFSYQTILKLLQSKSKNIKYCTNCLSMMHSKCCKADCLCLSCRNGIAKLK